MNYIAVDVKRSAGGVLMDKSQQTQSIWNVDFKPPRLARFTKHVDVDIAIVGAGITGLTCAALLKQAGRTVAVLEREEFGNHGTTHRTTGHLTIALDQAYPTLIRKFNENITRTAVEASMAAIDRIEEFAAELGFDNEFRRVEGYRYTENADEVQEIEEDFEAARNLGLDVELVSEIPLPFKIQRGFRMPRQGQFHPIKHLLGLTNYVEGEGSYVFHKSPVREYEDGEPCHLTLDNGTITAREIILATHTPMGVWVTLQTRLVPYHSYVLAARVKGKMPLALFWDNADPYNYIRRFSPEHDPEGDILIIGGADNKTGQEIDTYKNFEAMERYARQRFDIKKIEYYWSDQFFEPADGLPYIGRGPNEKHVYVATGYSGTGLTYGTAAGMLISDLILGRARKDWEDAFNPRRLKPIASAKHVAEGVGATVQGLGERIFKVSDKEVEGLGPNDGRIVSIDGQRVAVFRDDKGKLHGVSPVCTHMGCMLEWNGSEKHWDCKCHGSMFIPDSGEPFAGPASKPLEKREVHAAHEMEGTQIFLKKEPAKRK